MIMYIEDNAMICIKAYSFCIFIMLFFCKKKKKCNYSKLLFLVLPN